MNFWIFMLIMALLIPLTMVGFGALFIKLPPAKINGLYGYRTKRSMQNVNTWRFAHIYFGRIWLVLGLVMCVPSVVGMVLVLHKDIDTIGWTGGGIVLAQSILMIIPVIFTERALKRKFDAYGRLRQI